MSRSSLRAPARVILVAALAFATHPQETRAQAARALGPGKANAPAPRTNAAMRAAARPFFAGDTSLAGSVFEREGRERWLHGRQRPETTRFVGYAIRIRIDSVVPTSGTGGRTLHLTVSGRGRGDPATVTIRPSGAPAKVRAAFAPLPEYPSRGGEMDLELRRWCAYLLSERNALVLPEARVWDIVPAYHPRRPGRGAHWTDPVVKRSEWEGFLQELRGKRSSVLLGDTVVEGRRLRVVRDSAQVRYRERVPLAPRTVPGTAWQERVAEGTIIGRYLYDPESGLAVEAWDTTSLTGTATLTYADGRRFSTPARFERVRRTVLLDSRSYARVLARRRAAHEDDQGGMLMLPRSGIERRLAEGYTALADSLRAARRATRDPAERESIARLLLWWDRNGGYDASRLRLARDVADTAAEVAALASRTWGHRSPLTATELREMLPFLADPGLAFASGVASDPLYESVARALADAPPALTRDTARWPCTPEACRLLAGHWPGASEPRLSALRLDGRRPGQRPTGSASGYTYYLLLTESGWRVLWVEGWVT